MNKELIEKLEELFQSDEYVEALGQSMLSCRNSETIRKNRVVNSFMCKHNVINSLRSKEQTEANIALVDKLTEMKIRYLAGDVAVFSIEQLLSSIEKMTLAIQLIYLEYERYEEPSITE